MHCRAAALKMLVYVLRLRQETATTTLSLWEAHNKKVCECSVKTIKELCLIIVLTVKTINGQRNNLK